LSLRTSRIVHMDNLSTGIDASFWFLRADVTALRRFIQRHSAPVRVWRNRPESGGGLRQNTQLSPEVLSFLSKYYVRLARHSKCAEIASS